jgi:hypothetical protein
MKSTAVVKYALAHVHNAEWAQTFDTLTQAKKQTYDRGFKAGIAYCKKMKSTASAGTYSMGFADGFAASQREVSADEGAAYKDGYDAVTSTSDAMQVQDGREQTLRALERVLNEIKPSSSVLGNLMDLIFDEILEKVKKEVTNE